MYRLLAQITNPALPEKLGNAGSTAGGTVIGGIITGLIGVIFILAFILSLFQVITGGIQWATSGDDKNTLEASRNKITHGLVGLIIVASTWALFELVGKFFGLDIEKLSIPTVHP